MPTPPFPQLSIPEQLFCVTEQLPGNATHRSFYEDADGAAAHAKQAFVMTEACPVTLSVVLRKDMTDAEQALYLYIKFRQIVDAQGFGKRSVNPELRQAIEQAQYLMAACLTGTLNDLQTAMELYWYLIHSEQREGDGSFVV